MRTVWTGVLAGLVLAVAGCGRQPTPVEVKGRFAETLRRTGEWGPIKWLDPRTDAYLLQVAHHPTGISYEVRVWHDGCIFVDAPRPEPDVPHSYYYLSFCASRQPQKEMTKILITKSDRHKADLSVRDKVEIGGAMQDLIDAIQTALR